MAFACTGFTDKVNIITLRKGETDVQLTSIEGKGEILDNGICGSKALKFHHLPTNLMKISGFPE